MDLVGEQNFYREYEVQVQAMNSEGMGPRSEVAIIRSAMGCKSYCNVTICSFLALHFCFDHD